MKVYISRTINNNVIFKLLKKLKKYENIFSIKKASRLFSYKERDYIIDIIIKLLFNFLYNLFNIELIILRIYLNNILTKN